MSQLALHMYCSKSVLSLLLSILGRREMRKNKNSETVGLVNTDLHKQINPSIILADEHEHTQGVIAR